VRRAIWIALFVLTPFGSYEFFQKSAEHGGTTVLHQLSLRAEIETPWRPAGHGYLIDHALHELLETRRFCELTARRLISRSSV